VAQAGGNAMPDERTLLDIIGFIMDWAQPVWYLILIVASTITTWKIKTRFKSEMECGFERKVEDWELVSMNQWMDMYEVGEKRVAERRRGISSGLSN
jgi:hypothetical protein